MNNQHTRTLIAEGVIGLAVIAGGYMTLVDPVRTAVAEARAATADQSAVSARALSEGGGIDRAREALERARARAAAVHEAGEPARDELAAFEHLSQIASEVGVEIEQLQRRELRRSAPSSTPAQDRAGATMLSDVPQNPSTAHLTPPSDAHIGFVMIVEGRYEQTVAMIERLARSPERTAVESIAIVPSGDTADPRVLATIRTNFHGFDASRARHMVEQALARLNEVEASR